jgi:ABC-type branched-subunit amino acid transport system substrate-binding protein
VDEDRRGKPVSDILVIGLTDDKTARQAFEDRFVSRLKRAGVEAIASTDAIQIPPDKELPKETILKAVNKYGNDAVIITHLIGVGEKEVTIPKGKAYQDFFGDYSNAYSSAQQRAGQRTFAKVRLETNLYDVKTEKPLWSGQSQTWNPLSQKNTINEVIQVVIADLQKNKLLPAK